VTSLMRAHQILLARVETALRPYDLSWCRSPTSAAPRPKTPPSRSTRGVGKDRVTRRNPHGLSTATANRGFLLVAALVTCVSDLW
jgi:hypothetical protein